MKVYQDLEQFGKLPYAVVTSGTFDGVHVGHQKILARLEEVRRTSGEKAYCSLSGRTPARWWPKTAIRPDY
jgi:FAD synthase